MHLVDAIRKATQQSTTAATDIGVAATEAVMKSKGQETKQPEVTPDTARITEKNDGKTTPAQPIAGISPENQPNEINPIVTSSGGSVIRLELFLTPEQTHQMLRGIFQGSHTVMTLREASQYLRVSGDTLIEMAQSGEIPAFMMDNRWKFPKQGIDEWITLQTMKMTTNQTEEDDAA
jgi:excisionase family DNA binding protein